MSSNNLIIDGHHRYISSLITGFDIEVVTDYPEPNDVNEINWNTVQFLEEDWDSPSKIEMWNEEDAVYNDMNIQVLRDLLNEKA